MASFLRRQAIKLYDTITHRHFLQRLDELNKTQWLNREELLKLQHDKLYRLLTYAYEHVPYYQVLFDQVGFHPDEVQTDLRSMQKIPVLTKSIIRKNFDDLCVRDPRRRARLNPLTTGGSTGQPLVFMQDSNFRDYVTADLHRHLGWGGWELGQVHAYIWGANFEVATSKAFRTRMMDFILNRFVTNAYVLSVESMSKFAAEVRLKRPCLVFCYPSSLYRFAEFVRERGYDDIKFEAMFSSAEVLYPVQRQFIEQTFGGKMFNRYATRELACISCECEAHTGLHASIENVYIEIMKDGHPANPGETGDIVVTNLNNYGMPFIRYSVGDIGAWSCEDHCRCGRALPLMELVEGRRVDMFKTRDGRAVWGGFASPLFGMKGVEQFQLVQKSLDHVVARIVKDGELDSTGLAQIERTVKIALGDQVRVTFEFPDEIKVFDSGKYRYAISEVSV
jgi:phenylacetate-CoA ligase